MSYSGEVDTDYWDDLEIRGELHITAKLTHTSEGIELSISELRSDEVHIESGVYSVDVAPFERTFRRSIDPRNPEDQDIIDIKSGIINLAHVIREEILMALYD